MFIHFDADRASDSPFIERVWCCHSEGGGPFLSVASSHWEFVVTRLAGETTITLRGPETKPREINCPSNGEWFAIRFKAGTFMPALPATNLRVTIEGTGEDPRTIRLVAGVPALARYLEVVP